MKIGVISDTHISGGSFHPKKLASRVINKVTGDAKWLSDLVRPHFSDVDMIIHAGDFVSSVVVTALEEFGPVEGVSGNMDPGEIRSIFPAKKVIKAGDYRIGIMHGFGAPSGLAGKVRREFEDVDIIVFGHSHYPTAEEVDGVLMFNPGSPTDQRWAPSKSIGIIELGDEIKTRHIPL